MKPTLSKLDTGSKSVGGGKQCCKRYSPISPVRASVRTPRTPVSARLLSATPRLQPPRRKRTVVASPLSELEIADICKIFGPAPIIREARITELIPTRPSIRQDVSPTSLQLWERFFIKAFERELDATCMWLAKATGYLSHLEREVKMELGSLTNPFTRSEDHLARVRKWLGLYIEKSGEDFQRKIELLRNAVKKFGLKGEERRAAESIIRVEILYEFLQTYYHEVEDSLSRVLSRASLSGPYRQDVMRRLARLFEPLAAAIPALPSYASSLLPDSIDHTCPICLSLLHEPIFLTTCHHSFCSSCIVKHEEYSIGGGRYLYWADVSCPVCRGIFGAREKKSDTARGAFVEAYWRNAVRRRKREEWMKRVATAIDCRRLTRRIQRY
ncbi:hypothetical protein BC832DRAFT_560664 [Gaertneriomyces semiglobifer]|nr:hypothetical protein BC832DRAFT_560664 [Gaertneriomyces semiglobifer]